MAYKLKIGPAQGLKLKGNAGFALPLIGGVGIKATKSGGIWTVDLDYTVLTPGPVSDATTAYVAVEDKTTGIYREVSLASLLTSGLDADLQAIAALTSTGILVRTADDTWVLRAVTGTANEITVTNGDGVSGNPTVSLPAALTFTGKTVTGGTFQSPVINTPTGIVKGDVGLGNVDNTSDANKPISTATQTALNAKVAGPASAVAARIAIFSDTTGKVLSDGGHVLPSGTVVGTSDAQALSSKTITLSTYNGNTWTAGTGTLTIAAGVTLTASANATVSGTNTGDQTITLTGDITGTGTGSFAATIAANAVTNAKMATMAAYTVKGNATGSSAAPTDISIPALTQKASPAAADMIMIADSAASNALKYATISSIASAGSVSSIGGQTGAFTIDGGGLGSTVLTVPRYDAAQSLSDAQKNQAADNIGTLGANLVVNPEFQIDQFNSAVGTTTSDNGYFADVYRYLGEASATCYSLNTTIGGGRLNGAIGFPGTTDKGGLFQVIESNKSTRLRSNTATLSAVLSVSNTRLGNIKMGIVQWTGTADATTSDPISSWGADGTTPTLAANWSFVNTPANLSATTTPTKYSVTGIVGASTNNLALLIWNDDKSYTAGDVFYFTDIDLHLGQDRPYRPIDIAVDINKVLRYSEPLYSAVTSCYSTTLALAGATWQAKRATPAMTLVTAGSLIGNGTSNVVTSISGSLVGGGPTGGSFDINVASGLTAGQARTWRNGVIAVTSRL